MHLQCAKKIAHHKGRYGSIYFLTSHMAGIVELGNPLGTVWVFLVPPCISTPPYFASISWCNTMGAPNFVRERVQWPLILWVQRVAPQHEVWRRMSQVKWGLYIQHREVAKKIPAGQWPWVHTEFLLYSQGIFLQWTSCSFPLSWKRFRLAALINK